MCPPPLVPQEWVKGGDIEDLGEGREQQMPLRSLCPRSPEIKNPDL